MSTIVYQGLQSCFESQIIEKTTLKLKVPTPSSIEFGRAPCMIATTTNFDNNIENLKEKCHSPNNHYNNYHHVTNKPCSTTSTTNLQDFGGWTSLQTLSNISKEESTYVHPLSKQKSSYSRLSERSLALCTESLGSETGSDNCISMESSNIFSFSSSSTFEKSPLCSTPTIRVDQEMTHQAESSSSTWSRKCNKVIRSSAKNSCHKFPPPLTTIRGLNSVQFRPHREDGRLIIKAVEAPLTHNYLQAERSNGRLRLCLFKDGFNSSASNFDSNMTLDENEELDVIENDILESEINDEEEEMECEEEEEEESDMYNNMKWDIDGNKFDVEGEMGMEKCQRFSRCKEGGGQSNKVFCDWRNNKPLWVATS